MVYVYLKGHDFRYEVFELLRLFFDDNDIKFIENNALVDDQSILIENRLNDFNDSISVETTIIKNNNIIARDVIEDVKYLQKDKKEIKKKLKVLVKKSILRNLTKINNKKVPWGVLTGIRPNKIVHELLDRGNDFKSIFNVLTNDYLISTENAKLLINIAKRERKYVYPVKENSFSLYVGIPFCPTRCLYCSFPSHSLERYGNLIHNYTEKLIYEIKNVGKLLDDKIINTVYIGGGTPTAIPTKNLEKIIKTIYKVFGQSIINEFTVESGRPDTINHENLSMLKENKVNRISINPQTMNDETLKLIGRKHTSKDIIDKYFLAKKIGFDSINMDLIVGLPGETEKHIEKTMKEIKKLNPDNLTIHTMAIKRASEIKQKILNYNLLDQNTLENMIKITKKFTEEMNLKPYYMYRQKQILGNFENIGYAKEEKECIYNIMIMEERETIIATGAGATSKFYFPYINRIERVPNVKNIVEYLNRIDEMIERKKKIINGVDNY